MLRHFNLDKIGALRAPGHVSVIHRANAAEMKDNNFSLLHAAAHRQKETLKCLKVRHVHGQSLECSTLRVLVSTPPVTLSDLRGNGLFITLPVQLIEL